MVANQLSRRDFLGAVGLATAGGAFSRAVTRAAAEDPQQRFPRVRVSPDRVIRVIAGLRPFRPSGFVLKVERLGRKTIIHNYGHGGAGITLSWGTAALAVEKAVATGKTRCAVLGCGAVGLATARLLQRKGLSVTIYARDLPPETTSNIAGGLWFPASVYDSSAQRPPEFAGQFLRACRLSQRMFQDMVGDYYGVRWMEYYMLLRQGRDGSSLPGGSDLYPETRLHEDPKRFFGYPYALQCDTMMIEPPVYLNAVLRDFYLAGGKLIVRTFHNRSDLLALPEPVIVNCTGLGSRALFGDNELQPDKGQLAILLPQPEINYGFVAPGADGVLYMFPRKDGIVLGGTNQRGEWSLDPDPAETQRILQGHARLFE